MVRSAFATAMLVGLMVSGCAHATKSPMGSNRQSTANSMGQSTSGSMGGQGADAVNVESLPPLTSQDVANQEQAVNAVLHETALVPKLLPDGTKQFTLTTSVFPWRLYQGETVAAWGYNGQVCGPLIRVKVGDKVEIVVHNHLPDATTLHLHGLAVPNDMDGVPNLTQAPIQPDGTFVYRFTVTPQMIGTHYYHSHYNDDFQVDHGLYGPLIVDPATPKGLTADVDALYVLSSWKINGSETENAFSIDGKPYPNSPNLTVKLGQRVRLRLINASAEEFHTMHLHGYTFQVIARDGNPLHQPESLNTITLGPGETADIMFTADNPGKWMFHCHVLDHTMNPDDEIDDMGGLVSIITVAR